MSANQLDRGVVVALPEILKAYRPVNSSRQKPKASGYPTQKTQGASARLQSYDAGEQSHEEICDEFKPYLLVEAGKPISPDMTWQESRKYLCLHSHPEPFDYQMLLDFVYEFIQDHMRINQGKLYGYGYIRRYYLVYAESEMLELSPAGHILGIRETFHS